VTIFLESLKVGADYSFTLFLLGAMNTSTAPASLVLCCSITERMSESQLDDSLKRCHRATVPVTWVAKIKELLGVCNAVGGADRFGGIAVELIPADFSSRQSLREVLRQARRAIPSLNAAVFRGTTPVTHRALLVEEGIRTLCVDRFDDATHGNRRPAPHRWACRSIVWGLWEVLSAPQCHAGLVGRMLPWGMLPRLAPASLHVVHVGYKDDPGDSPQGTRHQLERLLACIERRRCSDRLCVASLSDMPALLSGTEQTPVGGSVLKAA